MELVDKAELVGLKMLKKHSTPPHASQLSRYHEVVEQLFSRPQGDGALLPPTVIGNVPRDCRMVVSESFGPLAPILVVKDLDDALAVANSTVYGLSSGVVTTNLHHALKAVRTLRCGSVNINEVPGYRVENSPFGGLGDSGLGIKEGVIEAMKGYSHVKTFSVPW